MIAYPGGSWDKLLLLAFFINQVQLSDFLFFSVSPKGRMPGETHQVLVLLVNWRNISILVRKKQKPVSKKHSHWFGFHDLLLGWVLRLWWLKLIRKCRSSMQQNQGEILVCKIRVRSAVWRQFSLSTVPLKLLANHSGRKSAQTHIAPPQEGKPRASSAPTSH